MKTCSIDQCTRPYYAKDFCKMHYKRWNWRGGDPSVTLTQGGNVRVDGCTICGDKVWGRGWCRLHWKRWRKYGDPLFTKTTPPGEHLRFLEKALTYESDECLLWPFGKQKAGYGAVSGNTASNLMCEMAHGSAPEDRPEAAHSCGNRPCVNKRHLRWASHAENMADKIKHGTSSKKHLFNKNKHLVSP